MISELTVWWRRRLPFPRPARTSFHPGRVGPSPDAVSQRSPPPSCRGCYVSAMKSTVRLALIIIKKNEET